MLYAVPYYSGYSMVFAGYAPHAIKLIVEIILSASRNWAWFRFSLVLRLAPIATVVDYNEINKRSISGEVSRDLFESDRERERVGDCCCLYSYRVIFIVSVLM